MLKKYNLLPKKEGWDITRIHPDLDAVIVRGGGSGYVGRYFINDGTRQFMDSGQELSYGCEGVDAGDLDGDGDLDIAIAPWNGSVQLWLNDGLGNFILGNTLSEVSGFFNDIILKDQNFDGHPDIFTDKNIWLNDPDNPGEFILQDFEMSASNHDFEVADINNDNLLDIYLGRFSSNNGDIVYLGDEPTYIDVETTICFGENIFLQNAWQTEAGVYLDYVDCNTLTRTTLSFYDEINIEVTENNGTLTATETGATYQWLDCDNGYNPITDETSQCLTPIVSGNYAVEITQNDICEVVSECYIVTVIGISENVFGKSKIYPNPTNGIFIIDFPNLAQSNIRITDITGKIIFYATNADEKQIDISGFENGIYIIRIQTDKETFTTKIVKR